MESALVKKSIDINAPAETVWQVLINAEMIRSGTTFRKIFQRGK